MGKLVAFWSPYAGKSKVTSTLCAIAASLGLNHSELSIAISHVNNGRMDLEEKLDARTGITEEKQKLYKKTGIAALKLNYRQATLTSEKIRHSGIPLRMNSLFLYPYTERKKDKLSFWLLTETLKNEFDIVFLDLESNRPDDAMGYLNAADLIVVVLPQDPIYWERFFLSEVVQLEEKNFCIIIGGYLRTSKYGKSFFSRNKVFRRAISGVIPINSGFFDAMSDGRTLDFFYKNQRVRKREENYDFFVQTKQAAECIRKKLYLT